MKEALHGFRRCAAPPGQRLGTLPGEKIHPPRQSGGARALYMAVLSAKRVSPAMKAFYEKKRQEGKAAKAA